MNNVQARLPKLDVVLREERDHYVVRLSLGLTLYLDDARFWAREGAASAFERYLALAPRDRLSWLWTSVRPRWFRVTSNELDRIREELAAPSGKPRHLLSLRVVDDVNAPATGFVYREVDPQQTQRSGYVQFLFPPDHNPNSLLELARHAAKRLPCWSGVGGYVATFDPHQRATAFHAIEAESKRFVGIDVQSPEVTSWHAHEGLPSSNWLTLIGAPLLHAKKINLAALGETIADPSVQIFSHPYGTLVQAAVVPTLGDVNRGDLAPAYAHVARALAPYFVQEPTPFYASFEENGSTVRWMQRFVEPREARESNLF